MGQSKKEKNKKRREAAKKKKEATAAVEVKLAPTRVPKRIRINFQGANRKRSFSPGDILRVPEDVPEESARSWLNSGAAVEDKSMPDPETKIEPEPEVKEEPPEPRVPEEEPGKTEEEPPAEPEKKEEPEEEEETKEIPVDDK